MEDDFRLILTHQFVHFLIGLNETISSCLVGNLISGEN